MCTTGVTGFFQNSSLDPFSKSLCRNHRLASSCDKLIERTRGLQAEHNLVLKINRIRETFEIPTTHNIQTAFIDVQIDYALSDETSPTALLQSLRLNELATPVWPLLERLLARHNRPGDLALELDRSIVVFFLR